MDLGKTGFGNRINRLLADHAGKAGESLNTYARRAIITRLVSELERESSPEVAAVLADARSFESDNIELSDPDSTSPPQTYLQIGDVDRLAAVRATGMIGSPRDEQFDKLARMTLQAMGAQGASISFVDDRTQFIKASVGTTGTATQPQTVAVERSACRVVVETGETLVAQDIREHTLPMGAASELIAYMATPIKSDAGFTVGILDVWDYRPRKWTPGHVKTLEDIAWLIQQRIR
ncbi:GAF domain-containing protein [Rhodococcus sp. 1R11]|uniref:GAF domain-containing protein n=1 Tax=Rhodococcus sp. 1R11 TaxID=2559614 RepID=UPI0010725C31|nr:GAF domain-containing protein [Rhodococcus sp. 1R11]TFI44646.1 GAF domain-containing protein [Rhodococcus sp. 1R11]